MGKLILAQGINKPIKCLPHQIDQPPFLARLPDAVNHVVALLVFFKKTRDQLGRVLQVAIDLDGSLATGL